MWHDVFSFIRFTGWLLQNVGVAPIGFATPPKAPARQTEKIIVPLEDVIKTFDTNPHGMRWYWLITYIHTYIYILHILFMILFVYYSLFPGNSSTVLFFTPIKLPKGDLHYPQPSSPLSPSRAQAFYPWVRGNRPKHIVPWQFEGLAEAKLNKNIQELKTSGRFF